MLIHLLIATLFFQTSNNFVTNGCQIIFDGIDIKSKQYKKEIAPSYFFSYTPAAIKNELKTNHLIWVEAQLVRLETQEYLNLNIHLYSQTASDHYGIIEPNSKLIIKAISGKKIELLSRSKGIPHKEHHRSSYVYAVSYPLDKSKMKKLGAEEIDKVGIQWSSGYEEYTIYEVDFLMNQLACLNQ